MTEKSIFKILFINPPSEHAVKMEMSEDVIEEMGYYPPLGLMYLASFLKNKSAYNINAKIIDCVPEKISYEKLEGQIRGYTPDMCAVTTFTPNIVDAITTVKLAKKVSSRIKTILGAHHVDSYPRESLLLAEADYICKGEGEESLLKLVESLIEGKSPKGIPGIGFKEKGSPVIDGAYPFVSDLDSLPFPDRSLIDNKLYKCSLGAEKVTATVMSSRGCPYQCTFCYCPTKNYRMRSVPNIIDELKEITKMGIKEIFFFDDLFNVSAGRVIEISRAILDAGLNIKWSFRGRVNHITDEMLDIAKKAGCERIQYGLETSSDDRLKRIKKNTTVKMIEDAVQKTNRHKIISVGSFMIGLPGETREEIFQTFKFMRSLRLNYAQISVLMPYPNTELYKDGLARGVIKKDFWKEFAQDPVSRYRDFKAEVWTEILTQDELFRLINIGYKEFYMRPSYILKSLFKTRSLKELAAKFHAGLTLAKEIATSK